MGVCSFAGSPTSIVMWSHYAKHHTGLCFRFDIARDRMLFIKAVRVGYSNDYPTVNCLRATAPQMEPALLRKHAGWCYESERRIVLPGLANTDLSF